MSFCRNCGKELVEDAKFCAACGTEVVAEEPVVEPVGEPAAEPEVVVSAPANETDFAEEKACLDTYYRLLRWERISWSISGKVALIFAIIFSVLCGIFLLVSITEGDGFLAVFALFYTMFPAIFFPIAIISRKMVGKTQYYMDTLYTDVRPTITRSESVGMMVFEILFGTASPIFFIINFVRTKCNKDVIARIIAHQQGN